MSKTNKSKPIIGVCGLCGKEFRLGTAFDLKMVGGKTKAVCKGRCDLESKNS